MNLDEQSCHKPSRSTYTNLRCRCHACCQANTIYMQRLRKRNTTADTPPAATTAATPDGNTTNADTPGEVPPGDTPHHQGATTTNTTNETTNGRAGPDHQTKNENETETKTENLDGFFDGHP